MEGNNLEITAGRHIVAFELLVQTQNCRRIFRKNISVRDLLGRYGVRYYSQITMHITEQISLHKPFKLRAVLFVGLLVLPCEVRSYLPEIFRFLSFEPKLRVLPGRPVIS